MRLNRLIGYLLEEEEDYRGEHRAPGKEGGAPLWDVTKDVYPDDIYTLPLDKAASYYGTGEPADISVMSLIRSYHNKPGEKIKIYRSVPVIKTLEEEIEELEGHLKQILRRGRRPRGVTMSYDEISDRIDMLKGRLSRGEGSRVKRIEVINPGDWVSIYRPYVVEHGRGALGGKYVVLSKTVPARELYTDGNSIYEWGWDPS
jgi:hypothetical protein